MSRDSECVDNCPVCRSGAQKEILKHPDPLFPGGVLTLVSCSDCDFVFLNPRLSQAALMRLEDRSEVYEMDALETSREIDARLDLLKWLTPFTTRIGRLLDVGCNRGLLLQAAKRMGWDPVGVELSTIAAERARLSAGVPVYAELTDVPGPSRFDLIVAWHVLEHTTDPVSFLSQIRSLLAPRGVVAVQVPSFESVDEFRAQERLASIICAVHNLYFTEATLTDALRRADLRLIHSSAELMLTAFAGSSRRTSLADRDGTGVVRAG
jgi:2-polyprenyl-3-methyl-5-hydroxy-6-metoxy-1,4-benzoquinol methylase